MTDQQGYKNLHPPQGNNSKKSCGHRGWELHFYARLKKSKIFRGVWVKEGEIN
jgi:hypothetical protein